MLYWRPAFDHDPMRAQKKRGKRGPGKVLLITYPLALFRVFRGSLQVPLLGLGSGASGSIMHPMALDARTLRVGKYVRLQNRRRLAYPKRVEATASTAGQKRVWAGG